MGEFPMAHRIRPSSRSSAPAVRPSAIRNSAPFSSMARALSTPWSCVVGVRGLFDVEGEEAYGSLFFRWSGGGELYRAGTVPALYAGRLWRYFTDRPS